MKLPARLTGSANRRIIANASSLVGTASATAGLGLVYWWFAAHRFSPTSVGLAYAAISAMTLLAVIAALGLGTLLMGELPRQPDRQGALISAALMLAGVTGGVLGVLFAVTAPDVSSQLGPIGGSVGTVVVFAAGVGLTTMTLVLDQALIGLLRGGLQFIRNIIFALTKFLVLIGAGLSLTHTNGLTIYSTWVAGILVSLVCLLLYALRAGLHLGALRPRFRVLRGLGRATLAHHVLNLALQISPLTLPILVTALLSARIGARFDIAWLVANGIFIIPYALSLVLYAVGAAEPDLFRQRLRLTLGLGFASAVLASAVLFLGAGFLISIFSPAYAHDAVLPLRILILGIFPLLIKDHYVAICRTHGRAVCTALIVLVSSMLELALAISGAIWAGLPGLSTGWVVALCVQSLFMLPLVYRTARVGGNSAPSERPTKNDAQAVPYLERPSMVEVSTTTE